MIYVIYMYSKGDCAFLVSTLRLRIRSRFRELEDCQIRKDTAQLSGAPSGRSWCGFPGSERRRSVIMSRCTPKQQGTETQQQLQFQL